MREVQTLGVPGASAFQPPSPALAHKCPTPRPAKRKGRLWPAKVDALQESSTLRRPCVTSNPHQGTDLRQAEHHSGHRYEA